MRLPMRRKSCIEVRYDKEGNIYHRYLVYGAFVGILPRSVGRAMRRLVSRVPHSWYIGRNHNIVRPSYRRGFTALKSRLKELSYYLDGTDKRVVDKYTIKNGERI